MFSFLTNLFRFKKIYWIIQEGSGILLYKKNGQNSIQDNYVGELLSAFYSLSHFIFRTALQSIKIDNFKLNIIRRRKLFFVSICPGRMKRQKIVRRLFTIATYFCSLYSEEEIENWDHNIMKFHNFDKEVKIHKAQIIGDFINKLWTHDVVTVN
ncbi:MAG: hypothetical protein ACFFCE_10975 [Promethearchaeota archaeon]